MIFKGYITCELAVTGPKGTVEFGVKNQKEKHLFGVN